MIRIIPWTSRFAAAIIAKPSPVHINLYRVTSFSTCLRASKYFSSSTRSNKPKSKDFLRLQSAFVQQSKRHCSHRRTMCKANVDLAGGSMDVGKGREVLPTNVKPVHYDLTLEPNFEKFSYEGTVIIEYVQLNAIWTSMPHRGVTYPVCKSFC